MLLAGKYRLPAFPLEPDGTLQIPGYLAGAWMVRPDPQLTAIYS